MRGWAGRAGVGRARIGAQPHGLSRDEHTGARTRVTGKEDGWAGQGLTVVTMKGDLCRAPGTEPVGVRSRTSLLSDFSHLFFCFVTCVCEGCLKSVSEWTEKKKKDPPQKKGSSLHLLPHDLRLMVEIWGL